MQFEGNRQTYLKSDVKAGSERHITNFGSDIKDSEIYSDLISQIAPKNVGVNKTALQYEVFFL